MSRFLVQIVVLFSLLVYLRAADGSNSSRGLGEPKIKCIEVERQALLKVKQDLQMTDGNGTDLLSSWGSEEGKRECCKWFGIRCDQKSGHVIRLDLSSSTFGNKSRSGNISSSLVELRYLNYLDLSYINLNPNSIPHFIAKLTALTHLRLSSTNLIGEIPPQLANLSALQFLSLDKNQIVGSIPNLTMFPSLTTLSLGSNKLNGTLSESIGQLAQLGILDVSRNSLEGVISEIHFQKLSNLIYLDLSFNSLVLNTSSDWSPPFQLHVVLLKSCKLGPLFPRWLRTQKNYYLLDISDAGISDSIPNWFWDLTTPLFHMNLSNNQLSGRIADSSRQWEDWPEIDLSSNNFEGPIPTFLFKVSALHLSKNKFSRLDSLCDVNADALKGLSFIDISHNRLSGELPDCWSHFYILDILNLKNNKLSGKIPASIGEWASCQLKTLHLDNNNFTGNFPSSLKNCTQLVVLDVGENMLSGPIPTWIGESLQKLTILSLRSNHFNSVMPLNLCHLSQLQLLDLSVNQISGNVPKCFNNFTAMKQSGSIDTTISHSYLGGLHFIADSPGSYDDNLDLMWKGVLIEFMKNLRLVKSIDLSNNKLKGEVPSEITELNGLVSLNLSQNDLSGQLPLEIGRLASLDVLDLSNNQFSGRIPSSLSEVHRLSALDLSNNNLSGKIPTGTQLQSFDAVVFMGNPELCGAPLPKCPGEEAIPGGPEEGSDHGADQDGLITDGYFISLGLGFAVGFLGVCGTLLVNKYMRHSYFGFMNEVGDWLFVRAAIYKTKLLRMIKC